MTAAAAAKHIRAHLLRYWYRANDWESNCPWLWPSRHCLVTLPVPGNTIDAIYGEPVCASAYLPKDGSILLLLREQKKESVLAYLDTLILAGVK